MWEKTIFGLLFQAESKKGTAIIDFEVPFPICKVFFISYLFIQDHLKPYLHIMSTNLWPNILTFFKTSCCLHKRWCGCGGNKRKSSRQVLGAMTFFEWLCFPYNLHFSWFWDKNMIFSRALTQELKKLLTLSCGFAVWCLHTASFRKSEPQTFSAWLQSYLNMHSEPLYNIRNTI